MVDRMRLMMLVVLVAVLVAGCDGLSAVDESATLAFEIDSYVAEATAIQQERELKATHAVPTVQIFETQIAHHRGINNALYGTVQALMPPTPAVIAGIGGSVGGTPQAIIDGNRWFIKTGMGTQIDSNGCNLAPVIQFPKTTPRIYATFKAYYIEGNTPLSAVWSYNGQKVFEEAFTLQNGANEICLWFSIDPSQVEFKPGVWAVQLYMDVFNLESPMTFSILES